MPGTNLVPDRGEWDVARAFKLKLQGLSYQEIADLVGRSKSTVVEALKDFKALLDNPESIRTFRENESDILDAMRKLIIGSLPTDLAVKKGKRALSGYQKVGMYGILFDKTRLLRGESTVNLNSLSALVIGAARDFAKGKTEPIDVTPDASENKAEEEKVEVKDGKVDGSEGAKK